MKCTETQRANQKRWYQANKEKTIALSRQGKIEKRKWYNDLKTGLACKCGESHPACLDFHHRDPATKLFTISEGVATRGRSVILEEIAKCDVICANCHRKHHYENKMAQDVGVEPTLAGLEPAVLP